MTQPITAITRRALLRQAAALPVAKIATPMALSLLGMANAAAQSASDYKALVCVFLLGANDHYNTVIPYDQINYDAYLNVRKGADAGNYSGIALKKTALAATLLNSTTGLASGLQMALHPSMTGMKNLFDSGRAGVLLNVGSLIVPTTLQQYNARSKPLPPKLFSHNDQQAYWQTAGATEGGRSGWGGRVADLLLSNNSKSALSCISLSGNSVYTAGRQALSYQMSPSGALTVDALKSGGKFFNSTDCANALRELITKSTGSGHLMETEYVNVTNRALSLYGDLSSSLSGVPADLTSLFTSASAAPANPLSQQLAMVAKLLHQRDTLGLKRQVYFVGLGGFDLHDNLATAHPSLLDRVSKALTEFNAALDYMGIANQVTTFTASDFGRTLSSNGDGSDHGWGSHHFVTGGAINGNRFYGKAPPMGTSHSQQVGSGRLLPSTSIEQMAVELARWFGVSDGDMPSVLPYANNFDLHKLGLFKSA